ncbi:sensor histidine kinase response regulator, PAS domain-containing [Citrifermentans bemidjiense Bem]|uniref:histidine kinase n=1 Tax=Citrifermentans bemidjiense (strain ATCC BAA-1014 / DSM 16622 / JCM 12645 / Bem) TaxID=404380 RepID=B5EFM2_CITBB|nr:PAS domain S-box protein [Citrifermentans bemidjiense]ACH37926.1 sensor histidine kinase response regulator, PAS domain-containing [Citrifermentans bemidjiense Bem]
MGSESKKRAAREIGKIVGIYALFGSAWIYLSGYALVWLVTDPHLANQIEVYKGLLFILVTSALLYQLITRFAKRLAESVEKLEESEARFQAIYHNVNDALLIHEPGGRVTDVNRTMCSMFGYSREEALQLGVGQLSQGEPPYSEQEARHLLTLAAQGVPQTAQWRSKKKNGTLFWSEVSLRRATINDEERIIVMVRDIAARKEVEEALRQNEEILKLLMEEMPAGVGWSDEGRVIQYLNGLLSEWLGLACSGKPTLEDLLQRALPDPEYRARVQRLWDAGIGETLKNGTPIPPIEAKLTCSDGSIKHVILNTRLIHHRILFIFTDITKWEALQTEILKAQKLESLGILAGGIAHDFNNILTGILGNISFAGLLTASDHPARRPLEHAEKASQRAAELAHQLLTFSRGGEPLKKVVSAAQLVRESLALSLHGSKVQTEVEIPESLHAIEADEGQMSQSFNNVIINACQAMPDGGVLKVKAGNVSLDAQNELGLAAGEYIWISFIDEGCGIPFEEQKMIFDPYFTTKADGTGLGLASVHSIVSRHAGKVEVISAPGKGTTLTFYLPSTGGVMPEQEKKSAVPCPAEGGEGPVLVMDDEEAIRTLAEDLLTHLGHATVTCGTGEEAVRLYREASEAGHPFFAAIMDLTVPAGMGGREAAREILAFDPQARLIVSSGYSNDPVMSRYADYGFCCAVVKPYRWADLQQALQKKS